MQIFAKKELYRVFYLRFSAALNLRQSAGKI